MQYFCSPDRPIKVGDIWISRKGEILEMGGGWPRKGGYGTHTNYARSVTVAHIIKIFGT